MLLQRSPPVMACIWTEVGEFLLHKVLGGLYVEPFALRSHAHASRFGVAAAICEHFKELSTRDDLEG